MADADRGSETGWRRYPPLTGALVATLLAVFVLPSALNVPQSNPTQTLEFAPVAPEDDVPPPDAGNASSLGLGSSSTAPDADTLGGAEGGPGLPPPGMPEGVGTVPTTKRCVGSPPRQTEDPLSPPCVAHFEGDNGGATHQGVTADEVRVLIYFDGNSGEGISRRGWEPTPSDHYFDLFEPEDPAEENILVAAARDFQRYFNARYQTYGRALHFWVYFSDGQRTPESRQADAARNVRDVAPFAVISMARGGHVDGYLEGMASRGVLSFGSAFGRPASFYRQYQGYVWSYAPSIEQQAELFASFVCEKVAPHPVSFSGNSGDEGQPRRIGLLRTTDPAYPGFQRFAEVSRAALEACGAPIIDDRTFSTVARTSTEGSAPTAESQANVAGFQQSGVTTIVWLQGYEIQHSAAAERGGYLPEWVVAGDGIHDGNDRSYYQAQDAWDHAVIVSSLPKNPPVRESECYAAMREGNPNRHEGDHSYMCNYHRMLYIQLRQFAIGMQVAGPRLTPGNVDQGFHAIPAKASDDPTVPACFYAPGDYTCVKDAAAGWWDAEASSGSAFPPAGCWRIAEEGRRHITGDWPSGDVTAQQSEADTCTTYNAGNTAS